MKQKWRVLLADDQPEWEDIFRIIFKGTEWDLTFCDSIGAAKKLIIIDNQNFDLALIDLGIGSDDPNWPSSWRSDSGEELASLLLKREIKVGLTSGMNSYYTRKIANRLNVPYFYKGDRNDWKNVMKEILMWNPHSIREKDQY